MTNAPFEEKQKTVTNKQSNTIQEFQLSQPQTKQVNRVMTEQIKGKTLTKTPVTEGKITLIYIKVEYTWGGRYFFIQDDANNYRNISEIYYNRMTSGKN